MKIAIIGGTGKEGAGLGMRWAAAGHEVVIGSRVSARAEEAAANLRAILSTRGGEVSGRENSAAAYQGEVIVLAVPYEAQMPTLQAVAPALENKVLITVVAPLQQPKGRVWTPPGRSAAEEAQAFLGEKTRVVAAFQIISAEHLQDLHHEIDSDVLICGDKKADREIAAGLAEDAGMRGIHAGPLQNAPVIEGLAAVMIAINVRYGVKNAGMRITGI